MNKKRLSKFLARLKTYLFNYKDGFFEFPYLQHSPQDMVDGFDATPFVKHQRELGFMFTNTPFMNASIIYHKLEEGLWVMLSNASYKSNINFRRIIDNSYSSNYYSLSLEVSRKSTKKLDLMINGMTYSNISWLLFKPESSNENSFFKGTQQESVMIFFSEDYLQSVLLKDHKISQSSLSGFFSSKQKIILWPEKEEVAQHLAKPVIEILRAKKNGIKPQLPQLKECVNKFFYQFIDTYNAATLEDHYVELQNTNKKKMLKVEKLLMEQIGKPFEGLEPLAEKVGVSLSTLKADFKTMFGESVYQYFRSHQLMYARQLLLEGKYPVKKVGEKLGYQSASKFSAAFKKQFDILPSEVSENTILHLVEAK